MKNLLSLLYICDLESHTELPGYKICLKTIFFSSHIAHISFSYHSHTSTPHLKSPTSSACLSSLKSPTYLIYSYLKYVPRVISHPIFLPYISHTSSPHLKPPTSTACLPSLKLHISYIHICLVQCLVQHLHHI